MNKIKYVLTGLIIGFIIYTLVVSKASSYLSDDPKACVNCHIMAPQYATWNHSSHRNIATCNDCHIPHNNIFSTYYFKAKDGLRHATMFTLNMVPQVIRVHKEGKKVIQDNCIRCHYKIKESSKTLNISYTDAKEHGKGKLCWECHVEVPHGRINSLFSTKDTRGHLDIKDKSSINTKMVKNRNY